MNAQDTPARTVLITGCSTGIGHCVAHGLKTRGYRVFATARKKEDVARLRDEGLESEQLDLVDDNSIATALDKVLAATGGELYGLFNNGAYGLPGAVEDLSRAALREQLETNLLGWHELTRRVIPVMRRQGEGRIIQNSSVLGFVGLPYRGAYNCSKHALEGLTDTLRLELADSGIQVSLVQPGPITSKFRDNAQQAFLKYIDADNSVHRESYRAMRERLEKVGPAAPFTLPPEAVLKKVVHALESRRARPRYYVTVPTYLLGYLKRVLSSRGFDRLLLKVSGGGRR